MSTDLLRAWERRYGLLRPERSPGGFRLYSADDERRVRLMRRRLAEGFSASAAARMALEAPAEERRPEAAAVDQALRELGAALESFRDLDAQAVLDRLLAAFTVEAVLRDVVLPYLHDLGERWAAGEVSVAQEHFASEVLRGRLLGLARGWDTGIGPRALLACVPEEHHELGLLCFGLGLREHGWRITYLGADTPLDTLAGAADRLRPDLLVACAERVEPLAPAIAGLAELGRRHPLALAGRGVSADAARRAGARRLEEPPIEAAARLTLEAAERQRPAGPGRRPGA